MKDLVATIKDLIAHRHEEEWFEFKMNWNEHRALGEYISAMSNVAAILGEENAYFVWGIENNTHRVLGTEFDIHQDVKNEPLQHYLARLVRPDIGFRFDEVMFKGKRLVVLTIPAASKVPTSFDRDRFIRIGSSKANLIDYPEHESKLFDVLRNGQPTIENTESEYQDLTFDKMFMYYITKKVPINKKSFKKNLGLLTKDGKYNLMAQLLSDDSHIPVRFSAFSGTTKASTMYMVREFGNECLLLTVDNILSFGELINIPQADEANRRTTRIEVPLFRQEAYKEAVINALLHNRWVDYNAPMFTLYSDRIEILSRGTIAPGQTMDGFFMGESVPVNQKLSDIFLQLHISERSGQGVPSIVGAYGKEAYEFRDNSIVVSIPFDRLKTEFSENMTAWGTPVKQAEDSKIRVTEERVGVSPNNVRVTVNNEKVTVNPKEVTVISLSNAEKRVLQMIMVNSNVTYDELAEKLSLSRKTVAKHIKSLKEKSALERIGSDKSGYWIIKYGGNI